MEAGDLSNEPTIMPTSGGSLPAPNFGVELRVQRNVFQRELMNYVQAMAQRDAIELKQSLDSLQLTKLPETPSANPNFKLETPSPDTSFPCSEQEAPPSTLGLSCFKLKVPSPHPNFSYSELEASGPNPSSKLEAPTDPTLTCSELEVLSPKIHWPHKKTCIRKYSATTVQLYPRPEKFRRWRLGGGNWISYSSNAVNFTQILKAHSRPRSVLTLAHYRVYMQNRETVIGGRWAQGTYLPFEDAKSFCELLKIPTGFIVAIKRSIYLENLERC